MSSRYPIELKQRAVELVTTQLKSIARVLRELNVFKSTLYYWLKNQSLGSGTLASGRVSIDPTQEIKRLRAQNEAMKKEVTKLGAE